MEPPDLLEDVVDRVAWLTLNRPAKLNAFTPAMTARLSDALTRLASRDDVGAIVLTGAGRGFCAGGDVSRMAASAPSGNEAVAALRERMEVARLLHEVGLPTIAMVNGPAAGAGMALALACDLRIAGASARIAPAFARVGLPGDFGGSYFLARIVGPAKARELYLTSPVLEAHEALALGLVSHVVPDAELRAYTQSRAADLAHGPRVALAMMKRNFGLAEHGSLVDVLDLEARQQIAAAATDDHREAARAFLEKRRPRFTGR